MFSSHSLDEEQDQENVQSAITTVSQVVNEEVNHFQLMDLVSKTGQTANVFGQTIRIS